MHTLSLSLSLSVLKISFVDDEEMPLVFNEGNGTVMVCATYDQAQLEAPSALIVFSIFTEPITATSKLCIFCHWTELVVLYIVT